MRSLKHLAVALSLIIPSLLTGAGPAMAAGPLDPPDYPDCGDSVQYKAIQFNASEGLFRYKIVVVGARGKLHHAATSSSHGTQHPGGPWHAGQGGFISPLLYVDADEPELHVNSWLTYAGGNVKCQSLNTLKA